MYEPHRIAGEILGHVTELVSNGTVTLEFLDGSAVFRWDTKIGRHRFSVTHSVDFVRLSSDRTDPKHQANCIASHWSHELDLAVQSHPRTSLQKKKTA